MTAHHTATEPPLTRMEFKNLLRRRVVIERKKRRWTQQELASEASVSTETISRIERISGIESPSLYVIYRIAEAMDTSLPDFLAFDREL